MKKVVLALALAASATALHAAQPSASPASSTRQWPSLQDWDFTEGPDFCEMMTVYGEGPTEVSFALVLMPNGSAAVGGLSKTWSFEKGKQYDISVRLSADDADQTMTATGHLDADFNGFIIILDPKSLDEIVEAGRFIFDVKDKGANGNFNVGGSDLALAQLKTCAAALKADESAQSSW